METQAQTQTGATTLPIPQIVGEQMAWDATPPTSSITVTELEVIGKVIRDKRMEIDELSRQKKEKEAELNATENKMLEALHELGRTDFKLVDGTSIYIHRRLSYTMPKTPEDRILFFNHLKSKGLFESLVTVHHVTMNAYCKADREAYVAKGVLPEPIPGISDPTEMESIAVRRSTK
jgi:hypothetical protein